MQVEKIPIPFQSIKQDLETDLLRFNVNWISWF